VSFSSFWKFPFALWDVPFIQRYQLAFGLDLEFEFDLDLDQFVELLLFPVAVVAFDRRDHGDEGFRESGSRHGFVGL
jgi:hypothetical protein